MKGEVIVQTYTPFHPAIQAARRLDYEGFVDQEIEFRRELSYPPYAHLVCVTMKGPVEERISFSGVAFAKALQPELSKNVLLAGPAPAPLARAKGQYRYQIILRAPTTKLVTTPLKKILKTFKWPDGVNCAVDVDAVSLM